MFDGSLFKNWNSFKIMLIRLPQFVFHVQAGRQIGMGHLSRSRSLMNVLQEMDVDCVIHLDADAEGEAMARSWGLCKFTGVHNAQSALVIDAVTVDKTQALALMSYSPRILISPSFNRPDIVSHALLRDAHVDLLTMLPHNAMLQFDMFYAFATAQGLRQRKLIFDRLEIGMSLSGGLDTMDPSSVLSLLDSLKNVSGIRLIDPRWPAPIKHSLRHVQTTQKPWDFFDGINLFIGGEGVMLAEAIAQGLPTISLSSEVGMAKNSSLHDIGALKIIKRNDQMLFSLAAFLNDRPSIETLHLAALQLEGAANASRLALDIHKIIEEIK
jgi:hypothetical protein